MKRKSISKKIRFEVFKRDKFSCQYCGSAAPEVVLELDHIVPVVSGGDNNIMNLITACKPCNRGKSYRELSDTSTLSKQKKQIEDLQERKEQLELLAKWRDGLLSLQTEMESVITKEINKYLMPDYSVSESYKNEFRKWLKKYTLKEILDGIDSASIYYLKSDSNGYSKNSIDEFLNNILKTISLSKYYEQNPYMKNVFYIRACGKNHFDIYKNDYIFLNQSKTILSKKYIELNYLIDELDEATNTKADKEMFYKEFAKTFISITNDSNDINLWFQNIMAVDTETVFNEINERIYSNGDL